MSTLSEAMGRNAAEGTEAEWEEPLKIIIDHYRELRKNNLLGVKRKAVKEKAPEGKLNLEELDL